MNKPNFIKNKAPLIGAIIAGGLASACCIGPLVVVMLGLGSAQHLSPWSPIALYSLLSRLL